MKELYDMGISESTLKSMVETNPEIMDLTDEEIKQKEALLKKLHCSQEQLLNIISSNSMFLSRTNMELINLFNYMMDLGFRSLNILFDSNPYILNLEPFEIKNYIDERIKNGEILEEIIDDLDSNPYLFSDV